MKQNRDTGIKALLRWYDLAGIAQKGEPFADVLADYDDQHPTFVGYYGAAIDGLPDDRRATVLESSLQDLAEQGPGLIPDSNDFFNALKGETLSMHFVDVKAVAVQTVQDVATVAKVGLGIYALVIGAGILLFFWNAGHAMKDALKEAEGKV